MYAVCLRLQSQHRAEDRLNLSKHGYWYQVWVLETCIIALEMVGQGRDSVGELKR